MAGGVLLAMLGTFGAHSVVSVIVLVTISYGIVGYLVTASGTGAVFLMFAAAGAIGAIAGLGMLETRNRRLEELAP